MPELAQAARAPARRRRAARSSDAALGDDPRKAVQRGLWLLSRSSRSEHDLRERLERRFTAAATASALTRLRALGYVDDRAWAAAYVERPRSLVRSARLLQRELRSHGISPEIAVAATDEHDDDRAALAAARIALRRLPAAGADGDSRAARKRAQRLVAALARRGFDPGTSQRARAEVQTERTHESAHARP